MPLQPVTYRVQEAEEPPSICGTVIGRGFFVGATLVVALFRCLRDRRHPSMSFRSIKKIVLISSIFSDIHESLRIITNRRSMFYYNLGPDCSCPIHRASVPPALGTERLGLEMVFSGDESPNYISKKISVDWCRLVDAFCAYIHVSRLGMVCTHYGSVRRMIRSDTIRVWLSFVISASRNRRRFFSLLQKDCSEMPKHSAI